MPLEMVDDPQDQQDNSGNNSDRSGGGGHEARDRCNRRRLPGAVCPDNPHELALADGERDTADRRDLAIADVQVVDDEERRHAFAFRARDCDRASPR